MCFQTAVPIVFYYSIYHTLIIVQYLTVCKYVAFPKFCYISRDFFFFLSLSNPSYNLISLFPELILIISISCFFFLWTHIFLTPKFLWISAFQKCQWSSYYQIQRQFLFLTLFNWAVFSEKAAHVFWNMFIFGFQDIIFYQFCFYIECL